MPMQKVFKYFFQSLSGVASLSSGFSAACPLPVRRGLAQETLIIARNKIIESA